MLRAHIYCGTRKVFAGTLASAPRVGDTLRLTEETYLQVTEVIWCLDEYEAASVRNRINIRTVPLPADSPA